MSDQDWMLSKARHQSWQDEIRFEVRKAHRSGWTVEDTANSDPDLLHVLDWPFDGVTMLEKRKTCGGYGATCSCIEAHSLKGVVRPIQRRGNGPFADTGSGCRCLCSLWVWTDENIEKFQSSPGVGKGQQLGGSPKHIGLRGSLLDAQQQLPGENLFDINVKMVLLKSTSFLTWCVLNCVFVPFPCQCISLTDGSTQKLPPHDGLARCNLLHYQIQFTRFGDQCFLEWPHSGERRRAMVPFELKGVSVKARLRLDTGEFRGPHALHHMVPQKVHTAMVQYYQKRRCCTIEVPALMALSPSRLPCE